MPCYNPISAYRGKINPDTKKRSIVFNRSEGYADLPIKLPCGKCIGCRLEYSRKWAVRASHEATLHKENSFITLTYNDAHLPTYGDLEPKHFTNFLKHLRMYVHRKHNKKIRYIGCGEYGEHCRNCGLSRSACSCRLYNPGPGRPHYHLAIYNYYPTDAALHSVSNGHNLYTSQEIEKIWKKGFVVVGDVNYDTTAYIARYFTKKINGPQQPTHYANIANTYVSDAGIWYQRMPEFLRQSRKPALGHGWIKKYQNDVYPHDYVIVRDGHKVKPPRYYDNYLETIEPRTLHKVKITRAAKAREITEQRLRDKERCHQLKSRMLIRPLEIGE